MYAWGNLCLGVRPCPLVTYLSVSLMHEQKRVSKRIMRRNVMSTFDIFIYFFCILKEDVKERKTVFPLKAGKTDRQKLCKWNKCGESQWRIDEDMKLTLNLRAERAGGHMSQCLLGWAGLPSRCAAAVCVTSGWILMPHSAGSVSLSPQSEDPSRWHLNRHSLRRGELREASVLEKVFMKDSSQMSL